MEFLLQKSRPHANIKKTPIFESMPLKPRIGWQSHWSAYWAKWYILTLAAWCGPSMLDRLVGSIPNSYCHTNKVLKIPLQDDCASTLQWRSHEEKSFAGTSVQTNLHPSIDGITFLRD